MIKSITARKMFANKPQLKEQLWGGEFWPKAYYIDTVGKYASEDVIARYVKDQGRDKEYTPNYIHSSSSFLIPRSLLQGSLLTLFKNKHLFSTLCQKPNAIFLSTTSQSSTRIELIFSGLFLPAARFCHYGRIFFVNG